MPTYNYVGSHVDLPPLPAKVEKEAAQSAFRMLDTFKPNTGDMQAHLEIYEDVRG
jgi:hypothetical protein